ncbi:hypothetical protein, partial [Pantoea sp. GbtcB22]|uniref:hypothetical protein n=1 Tax=Pantoea sp. GbtcB22 TaxID=2824767 RepID=UPI001C30C3A0
PLQFIAGEAEKLPEMEGSEVQDIIGLEAIEPGRTLLVLNTSRDGRQIAAIGLEAVIDSQQELR